jgi:hypothetical protein
VPLAEQMRRRGLRRAAGFARERWRERFAAIMEQVLDQPPRPYREQVEVLPRGAGRAVRAGSEAVLVPVRVVNRGTHALLAEGPGRTVLRCRVHDEQGQAVGADVTPTPLPGLLPPGRALPAVVPVPVPEAAGAYQVAFWAERAGQEGGPALPERWFRLTVEAGERAGGQGWLAGVLEEVQAALVEANRLQRLPDDYTDVTCGPFAALKRRVKRKLLGNFKQAYVDVLSRQQSAFNRRLLEAVRELADCCATLDHAVRMLHQRPAEDRGSRIEDRKSAPAPDAGIEDSRSSILNPRSSILDLAGEAHP